MNVELIDCTGMCNPDPANYAASLLIYTKETRLEQNPGRFSDLLTQPLADKLDKLGYIANTIRSSWEFVDYTFQVTGVTRAFTHQLVRTRTGSYAQQSQRSTDMGDFEDVMPETVMQADNGYFWGTAIEAVKLAYRAYKGLNVPTQDCRGLLPTNVSTNIIVKFNLRTLADLCGKRVNPRAQGEYTEVVRKMVQAAMDVHSWVYPFLFPDRLSTPALDALLATVLGGRTPAEVPELNAALKEIDRLKATWG